MTNEEFAEELGAILTPNKEEIISNILELVRRKLDDTQPPKVEEIVKAIESNNLVHKLMCEWADRWVANEVGNRLRCGCWDGIKVDRIFDSIWDEQFDVAIKDRIQKRVFAAIDEVIAERLKKLRT